MQIETADVSLIGHREENQDRVAVAAADQAVLLVVIDGMGGHAEGARAAETALSTLLEAFWQTPHPIFDPANPTMPFTSLLDVSTLRGDAASHSEESSVPDDYIEFSSLWNWPSGHADGMSGLNGSNGGQMINDNLVPLFAVMDG